MRHVTYSTPMRIRGDAASVQIKAANGALHIHSPYDASFVAALKARIPASDRKWDGAAKVWAVSPEHGNIAADLCEQFFGLRPTLPTVAHRPTQASEIRLLDVRYLGATKAREDGSETAYAWVGGGWSAIFTRAALMEWFGQTQRPGEAVTLYAVLGVSQDAGPDELKRAWRRLARQWHPDVCREPDAASQFQSIQEAYEILGDTGKRARYNAGLQLAALYQADNVPARAMSHEFRSPLRCGWVLAEGQERLGRFVVSKIMQWQDIMNAAGEVLVTTWAMGDEKFSERWVQP